MPGALGGCREVPGGSWEAAGRVPGGCLEVLGADAGLPGRSWEKRGGGSRSLGTLSPSLPGEGEGREDTVLSSLRHCENERIACTRAQFHVSSV